jgi:hypothetical protein
MQKLWHIEILEGGNVQYLCGTGVLSSDRDDALEYTDLDEVSADCEYLESQGYNASIETSHRATGHNSASRLEHHFLMAAE